LQRQLQRRAENADGCVAHEDVHAIELLAESRESLGNALGAANIGLDGQRPSIKGTNVAANLFSSFVAIVINDRYVAAGSRQFQRDGATDATRTSGDKRDFPGKCLAHASVSLMFLCLMYSGGSSRKSNSASRRACDSSIGQVWSRAFRRSGAPPF